MKNTMKQWIALCLTVLLCLSVVGCGEKPAPVDEDVSSLLNGEEIISNAEQEETRSSVEGVESVVAEVPKTEDEKTETKLEVSKEPSSELKETESPFSSATVNVSSISEMLIENPSKNLESKAENPILPEQFEQPPEDRVREHSEHSMEDFVAWLNSEEALTEENGVFADAVNFYRKRGSFPWAFASDPKQNVRWYKLYSNGTLESFFDNQGSITILPFSTDKAEAAKGGIVSYLKAEGNSVVQTNRGTDFAAITRENPDYYVRRDFTRNSKQIEAVYRINRLELLHQNTGELERVDFRPVLYWIQDGFCVEMGFAFGTTAEEAWNYDQEFVSSLSFREVALSASPLQAAK